MKGINRGQSDGTGSGEGWRDLQTVDVSEDARKQFDRGERRLQGMSKTRDTMKRGRTYVLVHLS